MDQNVIGAIIILREYQKIKEVVQDPIFFSNVVKDTLEVFQRIHVFLHKISISFVHISQQCGPSPVPNHVRAGRKESQNLSQSQSLHYLTISDPLGAGKQN